VSQFNTAANLEQRIGELQSKLEEAQDLLRAIQQGNCDGSALDALRGKQVFTLESVEEPYRHFVEQMQEGAITLDDQNTILFANACFARMIGRSRKETVGVCLDSLVADQSQSAYRAMLLNARTNGPAKGECTLKSVSGNVPVQLSLHAPYGQDIPRLCAVVTDLSRQRQHQIERAASDEHEELRRARDAAEQANRAKDEFLAMLSHELRTPLTPVVAITSMLLSSPRTPAPMKEDLLTIRDNVQLEVRLIEDLLDLNRIVHGKFHLSCEPAKLNNLILRAIAVCRRDARDKQIDFKVSLYKARNDILVDPTRIQQILWNLLRNAIKFTPPGGQIAIEMLNPDPDHVSVSITDTGVGIEPEMLPKLFNAFEQGRASKSTTGGLGLGLTISKKLTDLHGGTLTAHSDGKDKGARFILTLPLAPSHPADSAAARPALGGQILHLQDARPSQPMTTTASPITARILLIEDHAETARIMARVLEHMGYKVTVANTKADGLSAASSQPFDLIISDLGLPDGSGLDLMRHLRQSLSTPAIALTGYGQETDQAAARDAGFNEHLIKPVNMDQLAAAIGRLCKR